MSPPATIILEDNTTYPLSGSAAADGNNHLPSVVSTITIEGNGSTLQGSAMGDKRILHVAANGNLTLNDLTHTGGSPTAGQGFHRSGGAILNRGILTLNRSTLSGNSALEGGGALITYLGISTLNNSTLSGNSTGINGGGLLSNTSSITLNNSLISNNTASAGGGWFHGQGNAIINNSQISNNMATNAGGGWFNYKGSASISNSTISGNSAQYGGGFVNRASQASLSLYNSTVSGNSAHNYGAIRNYGQSSLGLFNTTVSNKTAAAFIGGITNTFFSSLTMQNSLIANSFVGTVPGADCHSTASTVVANDKNLIEDKGTCGTTALCGDPLLGPLRSNGGPTQTHNPMTKSPLIDMGDDAFCAAAPISNLDQRGETRPEGAQCDIGAVEYHAPKNNFFVVPVPGGKSVRR